MRIVHVFIYYLIYISSLLLRDVRIHDFCYTRMLNDLPRACRSTVMSKAAPIYGYSGANGEKILTNSSSDNIGIYETSSRLRDIGAGEHR